ncbi:MAG: signal peptidase II [Gemmatimonadaceae bacterium]
MADGAAAARKSALFWGALVTVLVLDVVTKMLALHYLQPPYIPHALVGDLLRFTLAYNVGVAFSMHVGSASRWVFSLLAVAVLVFLGRLYRESPPEDRVRALALGLICGGAVGNLIDRVRSARGVIDFIDIGLGDTRFYTFNVADMGVSIGAVLLAWSLWQDERSARQRERGSEGGAQIG